MFKNFFQKREVNNMKFESTAWDGFKGSHWRNDINVRDFIQKNYEPYEGDASFLEIPTKATNILWFELQKLQKEAKSFPETLAALL